MARLCRNAATAVLLAHALAAPAAAAEITQVANSGEQPRIVNGTPTFAYAAVGALLVGSSPGNASLACTGTLIGCRTFITAAHCVCDTTGAQCQPPNDPTTSGKHVFIPHAGFLPVAKIFVHPDYQFLSRFSSADVAIIQLGVSVSGVPPIAIADAPTPVGTVGTIVGYGRSGGGTKNDDYGIKRVGALVTSNCNTANDDGLICWNFFGAGSNTCNGDSGGPLFADLGAGQVLAGLTSGGASATCLPNDHSFDTDVGFYHDWVVATASYETLGAASCGSGSQVGGLANYDDGAEGSLAGCHLSGVHEFVIGAGSSQLRVSMNAKDDGDADIDLLVKQGAPPTNAPGGFDCKQDDTGQFGFCQFSNPAGGHWFVRVDQAAGSGPYQITLNDRNTLPPLCGNTLREPGEACDITDDGDCAGLCQLDCTCPAPQCGNGVKENGEKCDVGQDSACPGRCNSECGCDCLTDDLILQRVSADAERVSVKAQVDGSGGEYLNFNPSDGFKLYISDGVTTVPIEVPAGDPGWDYSNCAKRRFKWKGNINGTTFVSITDKTASRGLISLKVKGVEVPGAGALAGPLSVEVHLDGTCTTASAF